MTNTDALQALYISRLKRRARWVETRRGNGSVSLEGYSGGRLITFDFDEAALLVLLHSGAVVCDASQRIHEPSVIEARNRNYEVTQVYWSARA